MRRSIEVVLWPERTSRLCRERSLMAELGLCPYTAILKPSGWLCACLARIMESYAVMQVWIWCKNIYKCDHIQPAPNLGNCCLIF